MRECERLRQSTDLTEQEKAQNDVLFTLLRFPEYHQQMTPKQIKFSMQSDSILRRARWLERMMTNDGDWHERECKRRDLQRLKDAPLPETAIMDAKFLNDLRALVRLVGYNEINDAETQLDKEALVDDLNKHEEKLVAIENVLAKQNTRRSQSQECFGRFKEAIKQAGYQLDRVRIMANRERKPFYRLIVHPEVKELLPWYQKRPAQMDTTE